MKFKFSFFSKNSTEGNQSSGALSKYWAKSKKELFSELQSSDQGLSTEIAAEKRKHIKPVMVSKSETITWLEILWNQIKSPLILILVFACAVSITVQEWGDALVIILILFFSVVLSFFQEYRAYVGIRKLLEHAKILAKVIRDGQEVGIQHTDIVPGDIVLLFAGTLIPADGLLLEAKDLFVNEALLTGESMAAEKEIGVSPETSSLSERKNSVFMGTSIRSGTGKMLVVLAGEETQFGNIAKRLKLKPSENEFEKGLAQFGFLLTKIMFLFLVLIFFANVLLSRPIIDSLLFSLALAVGISPEMLPAILSLTLSRGAQGLAKKGVLIKRLNSIESLGSMDVLCSDKTGTLTTGIVSFQDSVNMENQSLVEIKEFAWINAKFQTGLQNALDEAILTVPEPSIFVNSRKVDEIPYDFMRKRLTIVANVNHSPSDLLITKGAIDHILEICPQVIVNGQITEMNPNIRAAIDAKIKTWGNDGIRVLGIATKELKSQRYYSKKDEYDFIFKGFLLFSDKIHDDSKVALTHLQKLGVGLKILTGDNQYVSSAVARKVGMDIQNILTGREINEMVEEAFLQRIKNTNLFVELDPGQKEKIVTAFKKYGHVVGYLGDGINDAPALKAADIGMSVESAVDVAREAADVVFMKPNLKLLALGIVEGRSIFANTLKYIFITTSANFGNMISMAFASLFLPFLPLLASQVLLNNFLSDIPALAIGTDHVDKDWRKTPHRWNISIVKKIMVHFGLVSSLFDFITFGFLLYFFHASPEAFRTGWFLESLLSELIIIFIVRTFKPFYHSRPSRWLIISSILVAILAIPLPYLWFGHLLGFVPLPFWSILSLLTIVIAYALISEITKRYLFKSIAVRDI